MNISFALVLFVPMVVATVFSIVYYSEKIREEALNTIHSELKIASILYQNAVTEMGNLAVDYAQQKIINFLIGYNLGEKIGLEWAQSAQLNHIDMITVVDTHRKVMVRSHAPQTIGDVLPEKKYIQTAISGNIVSGTEAMSIEELKSEGMITSQFEDRTTLLCITGTAPVYDRQRENIVGAIVVRRILDNNPKEMVKNIVKNLTATIALFEHSRLIYSSAELNKEMRFVAPPPDILNQILQGNKTIQTADMSETGNISQYMPITDFNGQPAGVLMAQLGVETYRQTRNTAILTLVGIFFTGFILATIVKTIIERRIVTPVKRLKNGVERVGAGDYRHHLSVESGDEIGELTESFNKMAGELETYDRQLKEYNQQLEVRVQERTAELQIANSQLLDANTALEETLESLNPGVSRLIKKNKQQLGLVFATEMVADVCNYTKMNMILGETMMGEFMKKFFREAHQLLAQYRGLFDKTVGDQIVVIFGTPKDNSQASPIHPFDAVVCALKIMDAAERINNQLQESIQDNYTAISARHRSLSEEDRESVKIEDLRFQCRIGINTSNPSSDREIDRMRMVMMGAETCIDYTAQGGAVIYAFRLESSGLPGVVHIGENTKRMVEHACEVEEMPALTLKGLGTQSRYRVTGYRSLFEDIYPKTRLYQTYAYNLPVRIKHLIQTLNVGKIQIREVRKIKESLEIDIPYLEHRAGIFNLSLVRSLLCYGVGSLLEMNEDRLDAMVFATLWHNARILQDFPSESFEPFPVEKQIPADIDPDLTSGILTSLENGKPDSQESEIIVMCSHFDHLVFDHTYLRTRGQDTVSAKEGLSLMKIEGRFDDSLLSVLGQLMIAFDTDLESLPTVPEMPPCFKHNPGSLATAIRQTLSDEERERLIEQLTRG